jgi:hypothetical protein
VFSPTIGLCFAFQAARDARDALEQRTLFWLSVGLLSIFALVEILIVIVTTDPVNLGSQFNLGFSTAVFMVGFMFSLVPRVGWLRPRAPVDPAPTPPASSELAII